MKYPSTQTRTRSRCRSPMTLAAPSRCGLYGIPAGLTPLAEIPQGCSSGIPHPGFGWTLVVSSLGSPDAVAGLVGSETVGVAVDVEHDGSV